MIFKTLLSSLFIVIISSVHLFAQDIIDIAEKMRSLAILPFPHHFELPDSNIGVIIRFEDFERVTTEELAKLNKIETIQLQFDNQFELDRVVSLLPNFPSLKYLVLSNRINGDTTTKEIKLPEILASYKNIVGLKLSGNLKINYQQGLAIFNELPNLQFLFFEDFPQALPEDVRGFKQLKGISLRGRVISFPEWISKLPNLESIYLSMWNYHGSQSLDYADALKKLQKLPFLKSLYLSHIYKNEGTFDELKFKHLIKVELDHVNFKSNKQIMAFLANQRQLKSIRITGSSPESLDANFSKLKQLEHLSMSGTGESLSVNFNLKDLTNLKSLDIYNVKLLLNQTEFPDNLVHLKLEGTKLEGFPSSIIKLHKLKALLLSNNSITHLPDNFSDLNQLENLDLLRNGLKKLPGNFGDLRSLKKLELSGNPITELPESIGNLKSLKVFKLQYGDLRKLPMTLGGLQKLEVMNLSGNFITRIPETLQNIKTLKTLNLSHNQLLTLPQNIGNMSALEELILDFNNINRIPESIGRLQFIKKISLSFNDLNRLPDQISNLKTLEELNLNAGKIEHVTSYQWLRGFYRSDDPKPFKRVTINQIENFPEDLSKWTAIKKIYLTDNSKINTKQLWNGLLTIPSKEYLLDVENCGITFLPDKGWERFLVKSLNISNNRIEDIPTNIQLAPYLSVINFNQNKLKVSPVNLNQYVGNKAEKALWFIELGILADTSLTRTDDMVLALVKKSRNHHNRKEFKQALADANTALSINDSLAMIKLSLTKMGELNYEMGNYQTAINYLSKAILKNKDDNVRIMNFVIPPFEYRAKSYLKLGDTLSAIKDYETLAENYSDRWGEVGLLYKATGKADQAKASFEKGIIKFQQQIEFNINKKQPVEMYQLSRLELMIIKEEFVRALKYANKLEKDIKLIDHITLLRYLKASAEIGSNAFNSKSKAELLNFIQLNKNLIGGWGYELFDDWLNLTTISQDKKKLIGEINNRIKP